ncbi:M50 family metallopeptidase [Intrasporangium calvum]|uniref:M50 family metallopeptidase n=1 Tax=Intrasporangium calvum TaxID=53358 RepID=A0ABT5GLN2_9MICO|nr:M50 family metallopeptidase [Intrasporangium calvum]MDC5698596.1 M50 family metallopeptidase [Intrasporangium calvum]
MDWMDLLVARLEPTTGDVSLTAAAVWTVLAGSLLVVAVEPLWRVLRIAVTLVHELGHAVVGMAVGRRFTGFVLRGDMSGHAVTVGRARGFGRIVSTWAGYPAPAVVGAAMAWVAGRGWSAAFIAGVILILLVALVRVRSGLTLLVMVVALVATASLWWWRDDVLQAQLLVGTGIVLVIGAWRHLAAVAGTRDRASDPGVLASLTHVPGFFWNLTFAAACAAASWLVVTEVLTALR